jgi:hypothetical protein
MVVWIGSYSPRISGAAFDHLWWSDEDYSNVNLDVIRTQQGAIVLIESSV